MVVLTPKELLYAERARRFGIKRPIVTLQEAKRAGIGPALAYAMVEQESGNGSNVFGHDRDSTGRYIFPARDGTVPVTESLYREYKAARKGSGNRRMQGVGPMQLTWWELQDAADREGGCWKPRYNMRVGFRRLAALRKQFGKELGIERYNGSGPAAWQYRHQVLARQEAWRKRLGIK